MQKELICLILRFWLITQQDQKGFSRFLETIGHNSGEELVIESIASDASVKASTVRNYIDILRDTLLIFETLPFVKGRKRKVVSRSKLWLFDVGIANSLARRESIREGSEAFGKAFEHFIAREIATYLSYKRISSTLCYWRTHDQKEVDFIIPDSVAIEVKATTQVADRALKQLFFFKEEKAVKRHIIVCREREPRTVSGIEILPWNHFLDQLWSGEFC